MPEWGQNEKVLNRATPAAPQLRKRIDGYPQEAALSPDGRLRQVASLYFLLFDFFCVISDQRKRPFFPISRREHGFYGKNGPYSGWITAFRLSGGIVNGGSSRGGGLLVVALLCILSSLI